MMRHKYLPRICAGVLGLGLALTGAGCAEATGPGTLPPTPRLVLTLETPPSDSLGQLGVGVAVERSDGAVLAGVTLYVDSAAGGTRFLASDAGCCGRSNTRYWAVVTLPGPGRHTLTAVGLDTTGRTFTATAGWTVRLPTEAYTARVLPDSGYGGYPRFVHDDGTVAGWVTGASGRRRPALWRNGALTVLALPDSFGGAATRVNAAGDVLLEYDPPLGTFLPGTYVRVRRADGATFVVGPIGPAPTGQYARCCYVGADLNEQRVALGTISTAAGYVGTQGVRSAVLDVARGVVTDSLEGPVVGLNDAGQSIGSSTTSFGYASTTLVARGFTVGTLPQEQPASVCDPIAHRYSTLGPVELDASADVLARYCGNAVYLPAGGVGRWLDRVVGRGPAVHLSRTGRIIAALNASGTIYLWRPATNRTTQVQIAGGGWQLDSLASVNASGQIAAHGVERATGRAAALLLTPAP